MPKILWMSNKKKVLSGKFESLFRYNYKIIFKGPTLYFVTICDVYVLQDTEIFANIS